MMGPRLQKIAEMVRELEPRAVCDVGTDHALVPIYLAENGVECVIATDIRPGPLTRARENIVRRGLEGQIETRLGAGLEPICDGEVDVAIIAGMGGLTICEIISNGIPEGVRSLVLQPMTVVWEVRRFLAGAGYRIVREELVAEREKLYNVMIVEKGREMNLGDLDFYIGHGLMETRHSLLVRLLEREAGRLEKKSRGGDAGVARLLGEVRGLLTSIEKEDE